MRSLCTTICPARSRRAFTLIEVMVSLLIATMILGASATVFVTAMNGWERGSEKEEVLRVARTTSSLIERHLRSAVRPTTDYLRVFDGEVLSEGETTGHRLTMISSAQGRFPRDLPPTDVCEIEFELDPDTEDGLVMRIDATPDDDPYEGGYSIELSPLVRQFELIYFDGEEWVEDWYRTSLPQAVELTLAIAPSAEGTEEDEETSAEDDDPALYHFSRLISLPMGESSTGEEEAW